jgi:hypothetical protein
MTATATPARDSAKPQAAGTSDAGGLLAGARRPAAIVFCGVLPVLVVVALFAAAIQGDVEAMDFQQFYAAASRIAHGQSPYAGAPTNWGGPYPYPPLPALLTVPLTVLPFKAAALLVMATLVLVALAIPAVLGVRDWRCYGLVLLWPPVISAVQTSNLTLWLGLCAALAWRYRDRLVTVSLLVGLTLAAKFFLWPLAIWLGATRRLGAAVLSVVAGGALLVASWAVIGFAGLTDYPDVLHRLDRVVGPDSYTAYIVGRDLGVPSPLARACWLALGLAVLGAAVVVARRGNERQAFVLALAASLGLTPIVWLHYFALLLVVVALARPTLGVVWFVPLGMVLTPGSGHPTSFQTAWTLAVAVLTIALALRACATEAPLPSSRSGRSPLSTGGLRLVPGGER